MTNSTLDSRLNNDKTDLQVVQVYFIAQTSKEYLKYMILVLKYKIASNSDKPYQVNH